MSEKKNTKKGNIISMAAGVMGSILNPFFGLNMYNAIKSINYKEKATEEFNTLYKKEIEEFKVSKEEALTNAVEKMKKGENYKKYNKYINKAIAYGLAALFTTWGGYGLDTYMTKTRPIYETKNAKVLEVTTPRDMEYGLPGYPLISTLDMATFGYNIVTGKTNTYLKIEVGDENNKKKCYIKIEEDKGPVIKWSYGENAEKACMKVYKEVVNTTYKKNV